MLENKLIFSVSTVYGILPILSYKRMTAFLIRYYYLDTLMPRWYLIFDGRQKGRKKRLRLRP